MRTNSDIPNVTDDSICEKCGNSAVACVCGHRIFSLPNKLHDTVQTFSLANVRTRDGNIMMTREQFHALSRYSNLYCNIPISLMTTKKVLTIMECFVNP